VLGHGKTWTEKNPEETNYANFFPFELFFMENSSVWKIQVDSCGATEYQIETSKVPSVIESSAAQSPNIKRINNLGIKEFRVAATRRITVFQSQ
jgi:hypothetical protein